MMFRALSALFVLAILPSLGAEPIYFLLAPTPYAGPPEETRKLGTAVIPLTKPEHIAHARDLIQRGPVVNGEPNRPIVGARVRSGKDGINRNYFDPALPEWSWHIYEVYGFADIIGGPSAATPSSLEQTVAANPSAWNEKRPVSFFGMTIVRELGPNPIFLSASTNDNGLQFTWTSPRNGGLAFTLESTQSLTDPNWQPVIGASLLTTNSCTLDCTPANRFYRVRAEID